MSIASEITRLQGVKSDILQAISDKGVTVPAGSALDDCPGLIGDISVSGNIIPFTFTQGTRSNPNTYSDWPNHIESRNDRICSQVIVADVGTEILLRSSLDLGYVDGDPKTSQYYASGWSSKVCAFVVRYGTVTISFKKSNDGDITPLEGDGYYEVLQPLS